MSCQLRGHASGRLHSPGGSQVGWVLGQGQMEWGAKLGQPLLCSRSESPTALSKAPLTPFPHRRTPQLSQELGSVRTRRPCLFTARRRCPANKGQRWAKSRSTRQSKTFCDGFFPFLRFQKMSFIVQAIMWSSPFLNNCT